MDVWLSWSSGKDAAWSLRVLRDRRDVTVVGLITTTNQQHHRVSMHATRQAVLQAQARELGLPLVEISLPDPCSNAAYERLMGQAMAEAKQQGVRAVAFGDLFLEDVRAYREERLAAVGMEALFPLWQRDTADLAREMIHAGIGATLTAVDPKQLDSDYVGRPYDEHLLADLPADVDPCGENGEFHTVVWDGPMFRRPLAVRLGDVVTRGGFVYADLMLQ